MRFDTVLIGVSPQRSQSVISSCHSLADVDMENHMYHFDISKYKDGTSCFLSASAMDRIRYVGRFLHHGTETIRKTKINTVQFDWPGATIEVCVTKTTSVGIRIKGDGNYFNVFVNGNFRSTFRAGRNASCCTIAQGLNPHEQYVIAISKRTEPQMRGALSIFKVCTFYGFIIDHRGEFLPRPCAKLRTIEFIGDEDTCAFGNECIKTRQQHSHIQHNDPQGSTSNTHSVLHGAFGWKGRMENVYNGYASILARMLQADAHILAWSGKGVYSNAADWGANMLSLWKSTIACREGEWDMMSWMPDVVVIHLGRNDLSPPAASEVDIVAAYALLLAEVRSYRPDADIFCVVCDEECIRSDYPNSERSRLSLQLQEIIKVAMSKVSKYDSRMHYILLHVEGVLQRTDTGYYAVNGHVKIAQALAIEITRRTGWSVIDEPSITPYPQEKKEILLPDKDGKCTIS